MGLSWIDGEERARRGVEGRSKGGRGFAWKYGSSEVKRSDREEAKEERGCGSSRRRRLSPQIDLWGMCWPSNGESNRSEEVYLINVESASAKNFAEVNSMD